ncbi:MAG TPA: hypothetical protein VGB76_01765 [Pyrinomonadaceae bacterium]|jgi:pyruvate/2-oxoglutarate dehydrogenase complex dihydrolipoamide acyltransferase (E2) component
MAKTQGTARKTAPGASLATTAGDDELTKDALQRSMEDARESIAQTVTDIKDTVAGQYQSVKESVTDALDWREQFRQHPVAWCVGALSVGFVLSDSVVAALKKTDRENQLLDQLAALADHFSQQLTDKGMSILAPALTGTVLVPILTSKINEMFGVDLSHLPQQLLPSDDTGVNKRAKGKKKGGKKKKKKEKKDKAGRRDENAA